MFTGIIERTGRVVSLNSSSSSMTQLVVDAGPDFTTALGDSVAVNGCCLTVTQNTQNQLSFDVSGETLDKTSLGILTVGCEVNLERALRIGDRLGGHIVSGHVDGTGKVHGVIKDPDGWILTIALSHALGRYCIPKGSICLDGISLTINSVQDLPQEVLVSLCLIPTTINVTTFKHLNVGQPVNIEVDNIGKYVERLLKPFV